MKSIIFMFALILSLNAASYITTADNENNNGTGTADNDMGAGTCVYNDDTIHPVEFNINVTGALPQTSAYLALFIEDVDWPDEVDEVFINGHSLGYAIGENNLDDSTLFIISDLSWVHNGNNLIQIYVDQLDEGWCARTVSGELVIDEGYGPGPATVTSLTTDATQYDFGDTVTYTTEIDTTAGTQQNVRVEISLRDANGSIVDFDNNTALRNRQINGTDTDPYSSSFILPANGTEGLWSIITAVYDINTLELNEFKVVQFAVPTTAVLIPTINTVIPASVQPGDAITITGTNFVMGQTQVTVGGIALDNLTVVNTTTITANIPANAQSGNQTLALTTPNGSASSSVNVTQSAGTTASAAVSVPLSVTGKMLLMLSLGFAGFLFSRRQA